MTFPFFKQLSSNAGLIKKRYVQITRRYLVPNKKLFVRLLAGIVASNAVMFWSPYLTHAILEKGINKPDLNFVYMILAGQLILFFGNTLTDIFRSSLLLHIGNRINISMVGDLVDKLRRLPGLFSGNQIANAQVQPMHVQQRVKNLLNVSPLKTAFSLLDFSVLCLVQAVFRIPVLILFITGFVFGVTWILLFLLKQRKISVDLFECYSGENTHAVAIITDANEVNIQRKTRQGKSIRSMYKLKIKISHIGEYKNMAVSKFKQITAMLITFIVAQSVIDGHIYLGTIFAVIMIIGQLSIPLEQFNGLIAYWRDAKTGMEKISNGMKMNKDLAKNDTTNQSEPILQDRPFNYRSSQLSPC